MEWTGILGIVAAMAGLVGLYLGGKKIVEVWTRIESDKTIFREDERTIIVLTVIIGCLAAITGFITYQSKQFHQPYEVAVLEVGKEYQVLQGPIKISEDSEDSFYLIKCPDGKTKTLYDRYSSLELPEKPFIIGLDISGKCYYRTLEPRLKEQVLLAENSLLKQKQLAVQSDHDYQEHVVQQLETFSLADEFSIKFEGLRKTKHGRSSFLQLLLCYKENELPLDVPIYNSPEDNVLIGHVDLTQNGSPHILHFKEVTTDHVVLLVEPTEPKNLLSVHFKN